MKMVSVKLLIALCFALTTMSVDAIKLEGMFPCLISCRFGLNNQQNHV